MSDSIAISVVVPVFDEEQSLRPLHAEIARHVGGMGLEWEVLYIDDRSTDTSLDVLLELQRTDPAIRIVRFRRNFGQTAAMAAGFEHARGRIVVTLDADLQNDPADIPRLIDKIHEGFDIVAGWRRDRKDGFVLRRLPSILANRLIAVVTGTPVHDTGCTLKAFRRELVHNLPIYAEQHRFLPVLSLASGARLAEIVVHHRARQFGQSKYGIGRATRVLLDLFTVKMIGSFSRRPLQYFALLALPFGLASLPLWILGLVDPSYFSLSTTRGQSTMVMLLVLVLAGVYFLMLGLLAELAVKISDLHRRQSFGPLISVSNS